MELADYNPMVVHIKGKNYGLVDAIFRLKTLNIYKEPMQNPKIQVANNTQEIVMEICATNMDNISTSILCTEQLWDKPCRKLATQICCGNKSSFKSVIISVSGIVKNTNTFMVYSMT